MEDGGPDSDKSRIVSDEVQRILREEERETGRTYHFSGTTVLDAEVSRIIGPWGQLGRFEDGRKAAEALLKLKPDFPSRGRVLIGYSAKFDDIFERIVEGLHRVGVNVEWIGLGLPWETLPSE